MKAPSPLVLTPVDRRKALRAGAAVVAAVGLLDLLLLSAAARGALWLGWVALLLVCGEAVVRVPSWATRWVGAVSSVGSAAALAVLVVATGGSGSPLFSVLPLISPLGLVIAPDADENAPINAAAIPVAGVALLVAEGRPATWIALWAGPVLLAGALVVRFSRKHRLRRVEELRAAAERAEALDRLARSERELARVERLARLPLLADGVAHDLNSPLAVVTSALAFARDELRGADPEVLAALTDAAEAAASMRRIVGDLQRLARLEVVHGAGAEDHPVTEHALREALDVLGAQLTQAATVRAEIPDGLPVPVAPRHAVVDLVVQMVRALASEGGGHIVVRAERGPEGLSLAARREDTAFDATAPSRSDEHLSVCRAYVEGLGGTFRTVRQAGALRLSAVLPVLQG